MALFAPLKPVVSGFCSIFRAFRVRERVALINTAARTLRRLPLHFPICDGIKRAGLTVVGPHF